MILRYFWLLAGVIPYIFADVKFITPEAGATIEAGSTLTIEWEESDESPPLDALLSYQLFLCAGGNEDGSYVCSSCPAPLCHVLTNCQIPLKTLVPTGSFSDGNTASATVEVGLGESIENAYFLKIISAAQGGSVINYSPRFSFSGMTGTFPPDVTTGLETVDGTDGPATENNIESNQRGAQNAAGADGDYDVTYTMQTGVIRYAPMPGLPPTKITAQNPKPLYPTSAVQFAAEALPTPSQKTTMTQSVTYSVVSKENTVSCPARSTRNHSLILSRLLLKSSQQMTPCKNS